MSAHEFKCPNCGSNEISSKIIFRKTSERVRCASCGLEFKRYLPSGNWVKYPAIEERKGVSEMKKIEKKVVENAIPEFEECEIVREKTVQELEQDVRNLYDDLSHAKKLAADKQKEEEYREAANQTYLLYKSYLDAGFDEEKAFEIVKMMLKKTFNQL